jgi:iron complex outermembrane receptor protein
MPPRSLAWAVVAAALVASAPLHAEPAARAPTADKKRAAKAYVDAGLAAEEQGDYDGAIALYRKAHDLIPHPVLLFNMGQSHRLAGRRAEALDLYRQYLAAAPRGDLAADARRWVATFEAEIARERQEAEAKLAAEKQAQDEARKAAEAAKARPEPAPEPAAPPPPPVKPAPAPPAAIGVRRDPGRAWRIAGISAAGVGVGAITVDGLFGLRARNIGDELSERGARYDPDREQDGESAERTMFILCGVGGALVAGGITAYVLHRHVDRETPTVAASVDPDHVGLVVRGAF